MTSPRKKQKKGLPKVDANDKFEHLFLYIPRSILLFIQGDVTHAGDFCFGQTKGQVETNHCLHFYCCLNYKTKKTSLLIVLSSSKDHYSVPFDGYRRLILAGSQRNKDGRWNGVRGVVVSGGNNEFRQGHVRMGVGWTVMRVRWEERASMHRIVKSGLSRRDAPGVRGLLR